MTNADEIRELVRRLDGEIAITDDGLLYEDQHRWRDIVIEIHRLLDESGWTPVEDELPEEGEEVFVHDGGTIKKAKYSGGCFHDMLHYRIRPSHWMYPPEPPTTEE